MAPEKKSLDSFDSNDDIEYNQKLSKFDDNNDALPPPPGTMSESLPPPPADFTSSFQSFPPPANTLSSDGTDYGTLPPPIRPATPNSAIGGSSTLNSVTGPTIIHGSKNPYAISTDQLQR